MHYIFIINGREDKRFIEDELKPQLETVDISYEIYRTQAEGDATRFVYIYCDFHPDDEVCFVACGGNGTLNEVTSGMIRSRNKSVALLAYGAAVNFIKYFPGRNFRSVKDMLEGETMRMDVIKCNNDYSVNIANFGFDSMSALYGDFYVQEGKSKPYFRGTLKAMLSSRYNNFRIIADGERISRGLTMLCAMANAREYGEDYIIAPYAKIDDGYIDVVIGRSMPLLLVGILFSKITKGEHFESKFCRLFFKLKKARHIEISSRNLIYMCLDGEITAARHFDVNILDKAVVLRVPAKREE